MKTSLFYGAAIAILGMAVASISGQTQSTTASSSSSGYVQSSKLVGTKVKSSQGEEIGIIKDVVLDRNTGCMAYTVLSTGGGGTRATGGGKIVAVPWAVYSPTSDLSVLTVTVDRERIYNAPVFDYARIDEYSRPDYINNVYGYYGVSPGAGVGVGVSTGTTTTTGAAGTAGATASPGAMGSPTAPGRASPSTRASVSPGATAAASPACYCVCKSIWRRNCEPINKRNPGREEQGRGDSLTKWRRRDNIAEWTRGISTGSRRQSRRKKEIAATPRNGTKPQRRA
jgi:sporulation protein YlmC with PRC-barrel domain